MKKKYNIGVNQELLFLSVMKLHNIVLDNMNDTDKWSSVDCQLPETNYYIELKYRQIPSDRYKGTPFDKKKLIDGTMIIIYQNQLFLFVLLTLTILTTSSNTINLYLTPLSVSIEPIGTQHTT